MTGVPSKYLAMVPPSHDDTQRDSTKAAAMSAGYSSVHIWVWGVAQAWLLRLPITTQLNKNADGFPRVSVKGRKYLHKSRISGESVVDSTNDDTVDAVLAGLWNREEFQSLFERPPEACFFVKDSQSRPMMGNQALLELLRQDSFETVIGRTGSDFFPKGIANAFHGDEQIVIQGGNPIHERVESILDEEGGISWFCTTKLPLSGKDGRVAGLKEVTRTRGKASPTISPASIGSTLALAPPRFRITPAVAGRRVRSAVREECQRPVAKRELQTCLAVRRREQLRGSKTVLTHVDRTVMLRHQFDVDCGVRIRDHCAAGGCVPCAKQASPGSSEPPVHHPRIGAGAMVRSDGFAAVEAHAVYCPLLPACCPIHVDKRNAYSVAFTPFSGL